jgi:hypothetical protein
MASCAGFIAAVAAVGGVATDAVGAASFDDPEKREEAVSQPPSPRAIKLVISASVIGFDLCQAAAASKVVTATLPR